MAGKSRCLTFSVPDIMINLDKMNSKFDLQNMDAAQLAKALSTHQNSLIKLVLIVGSLLCVGVMFNNYRISGEGVRTKMSQAQDKLDAIKGRDAAVQDLNGFKSSLPKKINEFELITLISNYAKASHVIITSLSPAESKDMGLYDIINVNFNGVSDNFKSMMIFLRKIEKSQSPLMINSWSGHEGDGGQITFVIQISAVIIHT